MILVLAQLVSPITPPTEDVCINHTMWSAQIRPLLEKLDRLEKSTPSIELDPVYIVEDQFGRTYVKNTKAKGTLRWADFTVDLEWEPKVDIHKIQTSKSESKFDLEFQFLLYPFGIYKSGPVIENFDISLAYPLFEWNLFSPIVYTGIQSYGFGTQYRLVPHMALSAVIGNGWHTQIDLYSGLGVAFSIF